MVIGHVWKFDIVAGNKLLLICPSVKKLEQNVSKNVYKMYLKMSMKMYLKIL